MKKVGLIGWRGMVGSVLMSRMIEEKDFDKIDPVFFTTSQAGQKAPEFTGVITSYSIHYTKLYDTQCIRNDREGVRNTVFSVSKWQFSN